MKIRDERLIEDKNEEINLFFLNPEMTKRVKKFVKKQWQSTFRWNY